MHMVTERTKRLHMLLSDEEHAMLTALSERDGLTVSDWIRLTVRREHGAAFGVAAPKAKRAKK